jgi:hypothetical protein
VITIGDKTVLLNETFIVPDGNICTFSVPLEPELVIHLEFRPEDKSDEKIQWSLKDNGLHMYFNGFTGMLGTTPKKPLLLGTHSDGQPIGFVFFFQRSGNFNKIDFTFLKGGTFA